jgi:7-carboxy-7-deazaguanine synthase
MQANTQIPVKSIASDDGQQLLVHSVFYTIQGEGPFAGCPALFVRLGGCNLQCPGCDTEYTDGSQWLSVSELIGSFADNVQLVVITGGEPFRQNISMFANTLIALGIKVQVETNGTLPPSPGLRESVAIVCSPKTGKVNKLLLPRIVAWKYVGRAQDLACDDGLPVMALGHSAVPRLARPIGFAPVYLQPMDEQDPKLNALHQKAVVDSCLKHGYRLCLQIHKIIGVE